MKFLPINEKSVNLIPSKLIHITLPATRHSILKEGLRAREGKVYLQSPELKVEPEGSSFAVGEVGAVWVDTKTLLRAGLTTTLDPESLHGIPGEYLNAFIVHNNIPPEMIMMSQNS